jgi:RNA polymerase sigma factor (sigma-70 family)
MLLQLNGIGNQKIKYKNKESVQFDSMGEYILLAKKSISKFANNISNGLSTKMLKDEDAISSVATAIMMADWRWDENYQNEAGTKKTKYSYRNQCAIWAIQTYISKIYKKPKKINKVYSLDHEIEDLDGSVHQYIKDDNAKSPEDILIDKENRDNLEKVTQQILNLDCLSARQKDYIYLYYFEDYTFEKIGKKYGITREAVRQGLNKAISILKDLQTL